MQIYKFFITKNIFISKQKFLSYKNNLFLTGYSYISSKLSSYVFALKLMLISKYLFDNKFCSKKIYFFVRKISSLENTKYYSDNAGARTRDPILKRDVLYLLSYIVFFFLKIVSAKLILIFKLTKLN